MSTEYGYLKLYCDTDYAIILIDGLSTKKSTRIDGVILPVHIGTHSLRLEVRDLVYNGTFEIHPGGTTTIHAKLISCMPNWVCEMDLSTRSNTGWKIDSNGCEAPVHDTIMCPVVPATPIIDDPQPPDRDGNKTLLLILLIGAAGVMLS